MAIVPRSLDGLVPERHSREVPGDERHSDLVLPTLVILPLAEQDALVDACRTALRHIPEEEGERRGRIGAALDRVDWVALFFDFIDERFLDDDSRFLSE